MDDLVQWLHAQLNIDAAKARAATPGPWVWTAEADVWDQCGPTLIREGTDAPDAELVEVAAGWGHDAWGMNVSSADQAHIAEWDPARVLREIDAKRQLLDEHRSVNVSDLGSDCGSCHREDGVNANWPCRTLRLAALPYADRPGFQESWRP